jgi:hypothetical protein
MRKSILGAAVVFVVGTGSALLACEGHRPIRYSNPEQPVYQPESQPEFFASTAPSGFKVAGVGIGGVLLAGSAVFALVKRA